MLKRHKFNEKKLLHKVGKHWCVVSIALLGLIGGVGVSQHNIHADSNNVTATSEPKVPNNSNSKPSNTNTPSHQGTWDNVNVNFYSDNTMELTGKGTISPDDAPKSLPFHQNSNDWKLQISKDKANVVLNNSNGRQFASYPRAKNYHKTIWNHFKSMDLSGLDTSKVSNMSNMFGADSNLQILNLSGRFSTKSVPTRSDNSDDGMSGMLETNNINKGHLGILILGNNFNFNKANFYFPGLMVNANGNDVNKKLSMTDKAPGLYYITEPKYVNIHYIDNDTNDLISVYKSKRGNDNNSFPVSFSLNVPIVQDGNYQNIMSYNMSQIDYELNIPNGYEEIPDNKQTYKIYNSHNRNIGTYINIKLVKNPNVHYQSDINHDKHLMISYSNQFEKDTSHLYEFNKSDRSLINNYEKVMHTHNYFSTSANSYDASQADSNVQIVSSAVSAANSLASSAYSSAQTKYYSEANDSDASEYIPDHDSDSAKQKSVSTSISYVNVSTNNEDLTSYSNEVSSLSNQVASYSTQMNEIKNDFQSLKSEINKGKATHRKSNHKARNNERSNKNYRLPRTNSKYWNRVRHLRTRRGIRIYRIHSRAHHKNKIIKSRWIKANHKINLVRSRRHNRSWIVTGRGLHHYAHYYWIFDGDVKYPKHFKIIK